MGRHNYRKAYSEETRNQVGYVKKVCALIKCATQDMETVIRNYYNNVEYVRRIFINFDHFRTNVLKKIKEKQEKKLKKTKRPEKKNPGSQGFIF